MLRLDRTTVSVLALVMATLALGGVAWLLFKRPRKDGFTAGERMTLADMGEFDNLDPELKTIYVENVANKLIAGIMKDATAKWRAQTAEQRDVAKKTIGALMDSLLEDYRKRRSPVNAAVRSVVTGAPLPFSSPAKKMNA